MLAILTILSAVTTTYTFDSNGNLTGVNEAGTLTTMVYDKENRLKEYRQGAAANTRAFNYDVNSLKQSETAGKVTSQLVWDGADMLGEVPAVKPVGAPTMPIRYDSGQGIMFATTRFEPDPVRTDTGADFIGSILIEFDENGDDVDERRYKPYGELLAGTATTYGWTGNTGSRATLLQYAEQYNRRRHYSTKLKQWTTRDPLWPSESAYGYVYGNPLTFFDPDGLRRQFAPPTRPLPVPSVVPKPTQKPTSKPGSPVEIIAWGAIALGDLIIWACTGKTGPFTGLGEEIGRRMFPDEMELSDVDRPCPKLKRTREDAERRRTQLLQEVYGYCNPSKEGTWQYALACRPGLHQTTTYKCKKNKNSKQSVSVSGSILCCTCKEKGMIFWYCSASVHPSGRRP